MVDTYDINTIRYEKFELFSREVICPVYLHGGLITDIETSFLCLHSSFSSSSNQMHFAYTRNRHLGLSVNESVRAPRDQVTHALHDF